jgi:Uma2 family endonuclease
MDVQGKPPEFVLEVGSPRTALNDYTIKREGYAAFGVQEYWRFDPTGGDRYPTGLAGERLVDGEYQPIDVSQTETGMYRGHSDVLQLDLCWEQGRLRWFDPVSQQYLLTHDEEAAGRIAAEARVRELEEELRRLSE